VRRITPRAVQMLRAAHETPGITRAAAARELSIGSGAASELAASLVDAALIDEAPVSGTGGRGRPTRALVPHARGPVMLAASIRHASWTLEAFELGNRRLAALSGANPGGAPAALQSLADAVTRIRRRFSGRVQGIGVAAPGTVADERTLDATILGWRGLDLSTIWPQAPVFVAGNDATFAAIAEGQHDPARDAALLIYLHIEAGLGGAILQRGRHLPGAHGLTGEFGHLPMGDAHLRCPCGAHGCWGTSVDGDQLARLLDAPRPQDPVAFGEQVLHEARSGDRAGRDAVGQVARSLGRGTAGLVNALDADLVLLGGLAAGILRTAPDELRGAFDAGLMDVRRHTPTTILPARLTDDGPVIGAAQTAWSRYWDSLVD
jgi:predicted NBD/HSP70 family sugar kinase